MASSSTEEKFDAAVLAIKKLPKDGPFQPSYEMMKRFYGLYKQATEGPCHEARPAFWNAIKKAKWDAWTSLGEMSKHEAQQTYVEDMLKIMVVNFKAKDANHMVKIVEAMPQTEEVRHFLQVMGPFFELVTVPEGGKVPNGGVPNGDVIHLQNGDAPHLQNGDSPGIEDGDPSQLMVESSERELEEKDGSGAPQLPNGHVLKENLGADETHEEETTVSSEVNGPSDSSHPIYADEEQNGTKLSDNGDSSSSSTEDEFEDSLDQPDVSIERRVRFADMEPLVTLSEDRPLTSSTPLVGDRFTTEVEVHNLPGNRPTTNHSAVHRPPPLKSSLSRGSGDETRVAADTSENIALILERLQRDMNGVIARLNSLETDALTQGAQDYPDWSVSERRGWWPFGQLNGSTLLFIILWPFIANWAMRILSRRMSPRS